MLEWMMAHPWMTLILMLTALAVLDDIVCMIVRAVAARKRFRWKDQPPEILQERGSDTGR